MPITVSGNKINREEQGVKQRRSSNFLNIDTWTLMCICYMLTLSYTCRNGCLVYSMVLSKVLLFHPISAEEKGRHFTVVPVHGRLVVHFSDSMWYSSSPLRNHSRFLGGWVKSGSGQRGTFPLLDESPVASALEHGRYFTLEEDQVHSCTLQITDLQLLGRNITLHG